MTAEIARIDRDEPNALTPMAMLDRAVASGASVETLERLMALQERWEGTQARRAFELAMAEVKPKLPEIVKGREVDFTTQKGRTNYRYEDLAGIARAITPILAIHGLSFRFRTSSAPNEPVSVTCIISHRDGHSEENSLSAGQDQSGNKNSIQAVGSTITYLQRYTLKAALGLAAAADDDGAKADKPPVETITNDQVETLIDLLEATGSDRKAFLTYARVQSVDDIPAKDFPALEKMLKRKQEKA